MDACLNCSAELKHVPGRRKKKFCDNNCRVKFFYKNRPRPKVKDLTKPTNQIKPPEQPKTNYSINTVPEKKGENKRPKTLAEVKALCPPELEGVERGAWIGRERQKYGI